MARGTGQRRVFLVLKTSREVLQLTEKEAKFTLPGTSAQPPAVVLEGVLALRNDVPNGRGPYDAERERTLRSMHQEAAYDDDDDDGQENTRYKHAVFLARECLCWRTARTRNEDFQSRMVTARTIIEGDGSSEQSSAHAFTAAGKSQLRLAYQPRMAPPQSPILLRDVPPPLVGTHLLGIELWPIDPSAHKKYTINGDQEAYEDIIAKLL